MDNRHSFCWLYSRGRHIDWTCLSTHKWASNRIQRFTPSRRGVPISTREGRYEFSFGKRQREDQRNKVALYKPCITSVTSLLSRLSLASAGYYDNTRRISQLDGEECFALPVTSTAVAELPVTTDNQNHTGKHCSYIYYILCIIASCVCVCVCTCVCVCVCVCV